MIPSRSQTITSFTFMLFTSALAIAVPAAPAPHITTVSSFRFFLTTLHAFINPAITAITVPC